MVSKMVPLRGQWGGKGVTQARLEGAAGGPTKGQRKGKCLKCGFPPVPGPKPDGCRYVLNTRKRSGADTQTGHLSGM